MSKALTSGSFGPLLPGIQRIGWYRVGWAFMHDIWWIFFRNTRRRDGYECWPQPEGSLQQDPRQYLESIVEWPVSLSPILEI